MADNMEDAQQEQHQEDAVVEAVAAALDAEASSSESEEEEGSHSDAEDSEDAPMTSALSQDPLSEGDEEQQAGGTNPSGDVASTDQDAAAPAVSMSGYKVHRIKSTSSSICLEAVAHPLAHGWTLASVPSLLQSKSRCLGTSDARADMCYLCLNFRSKRLALGSRRVPADSRTSRITSRRATGASSARR